MDGSKSHDFPVRSGAEETGFAMDDKTHIKSRLRHRHPTEAALRESWVATVTSGIHWSAMSDVSGAFEIFKKPPYAAGLKPAGRDVAQHLQENGILGSGDLHGDDIIAVMGAEMAETLQTVTRNSHQNGIRSAGQSITPMGDAAALRGIRANGAFNVKLTDAERSAHTSMPASRATNQMSGTLWDDAQQGGAAGIGAVIQRGRADEKQCYADI